jgi:DNA polymerase (family 10)
MIRGDAGDERRYARAAAYARSRRLESDDDLDAFVEKPPGDIDADVLTLLRQMREAGSWVLVESTLVDIPPDLRWLFESGAVTVEQLGALYGTTGATTAADLAEALRDGTLRRTAGIDDATEAAIAAAIPRLRATIARTPLGRAMTSVEPILRTLQGAAGVQWATAAGSIRRGEDTVGDLEIVAASDRPARAIDALIEATSPARLLHRSERRLHLMLDRAPVAVRFADPAAAGSELLYRTGSAGHLEALRARAQTRGLRLSAAGLIDASGAVRRFEIEDDLYAVLGLPPIPPEIRSGEDEVDAAGRGALPQLVARPDIRGDLHMHSVWSDGHDSIEAMVQASLALGYEYLAITDHSENSAAIRNLAAADVGRQAEEIAELRGRYPGIAILHGCEVDILRDGRLDFPDRVLERFDIVLASLHDQADGSPSQLMKRYADAMQHPLVSVITHPANRMVPHRAGYDLDYGQLFNLAAATGTAVEIDGAPSHLDLDGRLARMAVAEGATLCIDSDGHRARLLAQQMQLGITMARRGWVEPRHVLNTRPFQDVRGFIAAKRHGR